MLSVPRTGNAMHYQRTYALYWLGNSGSLRDDFLLREAQTFADRDSPHPYDFPEDMPPEDHRMIGNRSRFNFEGRAVTPPSPNWHPDVKRG